MKKITLEIESDIKDESVIHSIDLLHPLVLEQYEIAKKHQLIDGLRELTMHVRTSCRANQWYRKRIRASFQKSTRRSLGMLRQSNRLSSYSLGSWLTYGESLQTSTLTQPRSRVITTCRARWAPSRGSSITTTTKTYCPFSRAPCDLSYLINVNKYDESI